MIWLSPNEGHLHQTNVTIHLLRINLSRVTRIFITGWRFQLVAASDNRNQSVCMLQKHVFCREKVKGWNGHVYALPWGNSKIAQNPMRNFQKCTKWYEELPKMYKIPWGTSKYVQNPTMILRKCTKCFTNVNEAGIRYRYFMYSTNKCTDFNKNITFKKKTSFFQNTQKLRNTQT